MTAEAEAGAMWPHAEEHVEPPEPGGGGRGPSREPLHGAWLCPQLESGLPNRKNMNVCRIEPPGVQ